MSSLSSRRKTAVLKETIQAPRDELALMRAHEGEMAQKALAGAVPIQLVSRRARA